MLSVVLTLQMSHILRIWRTVLTRRPKFIGKLQSRTKVLGKYSYFSVISGFHHTLWNPEKICGYTRPTLFVGLGLCELENAQKRKSVPRIFSVIVALNCHSESSLAVLPRLRIIIQSILTVFAFGIRNSPGSSTSAVDVVKLLRKRHLSSNKKELKNGRKKKTTTKIYQVLTELGRGVGWWTLGGIYCAQILTCTLKVTCDTGWERGLIE